MKRPASRHLLLRAIAIAGLIAALSGVPASGQTIPDAETLAAGDLELEVLATAPDVKDPTALEVTSDGRVIFAERTGRIKIWHQNDVLVEAGRIGVDSKSGQCDDCPGLGLDEGGLHGLLLAQDFDQTGHLYVYYSVPNSMGVPPVPPKHPGARGPAEIEGKFRLSRFTLLGETLDLGSEVPILENPAEWLHCCHYGGNMEWLPDGTMLLSVGDDTISSQSGGFGPRDYRFGFEYNNADLTSQNLADRRGKLLRLDPEDIDGDGSYLPTDNPFAGNPDADPYVYAYGFRSNYRFAIDPRTGRAFVGTVGPDGKNPDPNRGPASHEEIEEVPPGGGTNHGWPRCIANNIPYNDYDWQTGQAGAPLSCAGMTPASIWYTYTPSPTSPYVQLGSGGTCDAVMGGTVYLRPQTGALRLPPRFDGQLLWMEWCRGLVISTPIKADGTLDNRPEQVKVVFGGGASSPVPATAVTPQLRSPIDSTVGPDGALYIAEYASRNYSSTNSRISRITCAGCEPTPADYGGAPVSDPDASLTRAGAIPAPSGSTERWLLMFGLIVSALVYGLRRNRALS